MSFNSCLTFLQMYLLSCLPCHLIVRLTWQQQRIVCLVKLHSQMQLKNAIICMFPCHQRVISASCTLKRPHSLSICVLVGWLVGAASCVSPPRNKSVCMSIAPLLRGTDGWWRSGMGMTRRKSSIEKRWTKSLRCWCQFRQMLRISHTQMPMDRYTTDECCLSR